jgi:hypothetical protein
MPRKAKALWGFFFVYAPVHELGGFVEVISQAGMWREAKG